MGDWLWRIWVLGFLFFCCHQLLQGAVYLLSLLHYLIKDGVEPFIRSNYFDLGMIMDYWGEERLNHHTEATSMLFCASECARIVLEEGVDNVVTRHKLHGDAMLAGVQALGLKVFGDISNKMNKVILLFILQYNKYE